MNRDDSTENVLHRLRKKPRGPVGLNLAVERKLLTAIFYVLSVVGALLAFGGLVWQFMGGPPNVAMIGVLLIALAVLLGYTWGSEI